MKYVDRCIIYIMCSFYEPCAKNVQSLSKYFSFCL